MEVFRHSLVNNALKTLLSSLTIGKLQTSMYESLMLCGIKEGILFGSQYFYCLAQSWPMLLTVKQTHYQKYAIFHI
jgi:hypothetical protein